MSGGHSMNVSEELSLSHEARSPSPLRIFLYIICSVGILLNVAVFFRRKYTSKRQGPATRISLQLLCVMAAADTLSLLALFIMLCTQYMGVSSRLVMDLMCKVDLFVIHASSAFSVWCWLILSAIRYVAVYRPYAHLKMSREPLLGIIFIAVMCVTFESWILYSVSYIPEIKGCGEMMPAERGKTLQLIEILWSYFIPVGAIIVLDSKAVCFRSEWWKPTLATDLRAPAGSRPSLQAANKPSSMEEMSMNESDRKKSSEEAQGSNNKWDSKKVIASKAMRSRKSMQQIRIIRRCLFITVVDLTMNLPNYVLRLYFNLSTEEEFPFVLGVIEEISHILYFAQFAMNAIYLICIIYDAPRRNNTGVRQRSSSGVSLCELLPSSKYQYQQKKISAKPSPPSQR
uniref:G_PROTEIN_RECEP_F1_2 domain-containing protein n=1 Tax=Steinernema glaseri TaxID=37863 RepID=A0A1I7YVH2_9BILA